MGVAPLFAPVLPILNSGSEHGLGCFVEPASLAGGQIFLNGSDLRAAAQMDVSGLPAHGVKEAFLVAIVRQGSELNPGTIRREAPDDPAFVEVHVRIANPNRPRNNLLLGEGSLFLRLACGPDPSRLGQRLGFADDVSAMPLKERQDARLAEAAQS